MKRILLSILVVLSFGLAVVALHDQPALAAAKDEICAGVGAASGTGGCTTSDGTSINKLIDTIINVLSLLVGIVAVIMIIIGGFQYITSGGDSGKITTAKHTILYAVIGLVVVAFAQTIVKFVLARV